MATSTACKTPLLARIRKCRKQPIMLHGRNHPRSNPARFRVYFAHISAKGAQGLPAILENVATTQSSTRAVERETPQRFCSSPPCAAQITKRAGSFANSKPARHVPRRHKREPMTDFEYDPRKSESNKMKHEVDFEEAKALWNDPKAILVPARSDDEIRYLVIGKMQGKHWTAVATNRGANVRIISVRRSRQEEEALYDENN